MATLLVYWLRERTGDRQRRPRGAKGAPWDSEASHRIPSLALAAVLALLVIWGAYRFSFGPMEPDSLSGHRPLETVDRLIGHASVPAPELFNGIAEVEWHNARGHACWLLGEYSTKGWWYFFPIVLAVKTPIAFFLLCIVGYDACFSRGFRKYWQAWVPGVCAPVILAASMPSHINLGVRHILAMYPMLAIIAGFGATSLIRRRKAAMALGIALLAWQTVSSALAHPDYLAYFNEIVWSEPERILSDSDLDWGRIYSV